MNHRKRHFFLFLPASFLAITGCAAPGGEGRGEAPEDTGDVAEAAQATCAAGALDSADWGAWEAIPGIAGACGVPATAHHGDRLFAAYSACGTNQIHVTSYHAGAWTTPYAIANAFSMHSPSLAVYDRDLYLGHAGLDDRVFISRFNGLHWTGVGFASVTTTFAPVLTTYHDQLAAIYGGPGSEIHFTTWDSRVWSAGVGWGVTSVVTPGVAMFDGRLYAAYPDGRGKVALGYWDGVAFAGAGYLPGVHSLYAPTMAAHGGYLNFFFPHTQRGGFGWTAFDGEVWAGNVVIPGELASVSPRLGLYGDHAALFARGLDDEIYWARHAGWDL